MKSTLAGLVYLLTIAMGWSVQRRQHGPVDPSTDPNCNYYDDAIGTSNNCAYFEDFWGISHADFVSWVRVPSVCPLSVLFCTPNWS